MPTAKITWYKGAIYHISNLTRTELGSTPGKTKVSRYKHFTIIKCLVRCFSFLNIVYQRDISKNIYPLF
ncbi:hypothetical protein DIC82_02450 [Clostridium beijerinckii]|nr:hypothetical protein DIC82_02450 [Clostridium beijerinckii]